MNDLIIFNLQEMYNFNRYKKDTWKAKAYNDAIRLIKTIQIPIHSADDIQSLKLGKSIKEKVMYIIDHKTNIPQLSQETTQTINNIHCINELSNIHNIGIVKAKELVEEHGITSFDNLLENLHLLNMKQRQGVQYHYEIQQKIPRNEMNVHNEVIKTIVNESFPDTKNFSLVGSYRRNKDESGDIDLIIDAKTNFSMTDLVDVMISEGYIQEDGIFALGKKKFMGMCKLPSHAISRRIDILLTPSSEYAFALLYFTGSKEFNVKMRERAKQLGYRLNEKGLIDNTMTKIKGLKSEKDIFKFLKIKYVEPVQRYIDNYEEYS